MCEKLSDVTACVCKCQRQCAGLSHSPCAIKVYSRCHLVCLLFLCVAMLLVKVSLSPLSKQGRGREKLKWGTERVKQKHTEGEEAGCVKDATSGEYKYVKMERPRVGETGSVCLTSVSAMCRGQTQAAIQVVEGWQQALCVGRLQPSCYIAYWHTHTHNNTFKSDRSLVYLIFHLHCSQKHLINISSKDINTQYNRQIKCNKMSSGTFCLSRHVCYQAVKTELISSASENVKHEQLENITNNTGWGSTNAVKRQKVSSKAQRDEECWHQGKKHSKICL